MKMLQQIRDWNTARRLAAAEREAKIAAEEAEIKARAIAEAERKVADELKKIADDEKRAAADAAQEIADAEEKRIAAMDPKTRATHFEQPYVVVESLDLEREDPSKGSFLLDWNEYFVVALRGAGYTGIKDEEVIDMWFTELCAGIARDTIMKDVINPTATEPRKFMKKGKDGMTEYR
jgi:hypothetical protein